MTWSIRARLTAWYSLVVVTVLVAGATSVAVVQQRLAFARLDGELERLMLTLEGVMRTEFGEGLDLRGAVNEASIEVVAPDRTLVLASSDGVVLATWGHRSAAGWSPPIAQAMLGTLVVGGTRVRAFSHPVTHQGRRYIAAVVAPLDILDAETSELRVALAAGVLVALAVAIVGGWVVGRQTLRPLAEMAGQATAISDRDLTVRLHARSSGDELGRFAAAFNALLDRLAAALHAQRQFMADASHELRTPVSVVRTTAQVTLARPSRSEDEYRESFTIVAEQSARLARLVDAMFLLSRAEAQGIPLRPEPLYVDELAADCVRALRVLADERGVSVDVDAEPEVMISGDNTLLRQMVGNLLDNAIRHAKPGGTVKLTVRRTTTGTTIGVSDDGLGIPVTEQARVFQRFVRLDVRSGGAGLGLPIARWIAEAHGGRLVLESSSDAGSRFTATLPGR